MNKLAVIGALGLMASGLYAQGLNTGGQVKDDWEEINFEFNSSILSDGYPSLLRLADLLSQHRDFHVKVTGNTDYVGSAAYNDRLALARANSVKEFLVHYGANADQITTAGNGKASPEVDNRTKEGRFMNRRVVLQVTDGTGKLIKEGGISDVMPDLMALLKKNEECCEQVLKRLDKLDDILSALKNMQGDNDKLRADLDALRNEHNALKDQVAALPKPLSEQQTTNIANNAAQGALEEAQRRNKKYATVGLDIGPAFGGGRTGDFTASGRGQFFAPFGGDGMRAVQAQGEMMYYPGSVEGQFDVGLVNRFGGNWQAGAFASFKYINFKQYQTGAGLGESSFMLDYLFNGGRFGIFGTQGFKDIGVMNSMTLAPGAYLQTIARLVNQYGADFLFSTWGKAYIQGNVGWLRTYQGPSNQHIGADVKLIQPLSEHVAFTAEAAWNPTYLQAHGSGQLVLGLQAGNFIAPHDYTKVTSPVPMDVPRIRYEFQTRKVGSSPPVADAGPNQLGINAGPVTLNGSGSYDPLGETLTYNWVQILGPAVTLSNANQAVATFTAAAGQNYAFRLTVTNTDNLKSTASTEVSTVSPGQVNILQFTANPASIASGGSSTLVWVVQNATNVSISPGPGAVNAQSGSTSVSPTQTTTYTLTATGNGGTITASTTITVTPQTVNSPQIVRFEANPLTISPGQNSTLSWATNNATAVSINNGVGTVQPNGSVTVSPTQTTTYVLTATNSNGQSVTSPVTVTVSTGQIPQVVVFVANPQNISPGTSTKLCWQVNNATSISIQPTVGSNLNANDCATVSPNQTTTYTLTATNAAGQIQANTTVFVGTVQILSFTATPPVSTIAGGPVTLAWTTANATTVVLIGADVPAQTLPVNGTLTINPITNGAYTLTAYGPGGQTVSDTITVFVR